MILSSMEIDGVISDITDMVSLLKMKGNTELILGGVTYVDDEYNITIINPAMDSIATLQVNSVYVLNRILIELGSMGVEGALCYTTGDLDFEEVMMVIDNKDNRFNPETIETIKDRYEFLNRGFTQVEKVVIAL